MPLTRPEALALAQELITRAADQLNAEYLASWHTVRSNPDLVRAKGQVLAEVKARVLSLIDQERVLQNG